MPTSIGPLPQRGMSARLTPIQWTAVEACCSEIRTWPAKTLISRMNDPLDRSLLLLDGFVGRHVPTANRSVREMVALEIPGDFVDLHSFPVGLLDHDVTALTNVRMAVFPHTALRRLTKTDPDVAIALWAQTVVDAAIHRYWSFRIGALRATGRIANFLCEMHLRMDMAGLVHGSDFDLPMTQTDLGEACGMSTVHVNRVVRELREAACCTIRDGRVHVQDLAALRRIGQFQDSFLLRETVEQG